MFESVVELGDQRQPILPELTPEHSKLPQKNSDYQSLIKYFYFFFKRPVRFSPAKRTKMQTVGNGLTSKSIFNQKNYLL